MELQPHTVIEIAVVLLSMIGLVLTVHKMTRKSRKEVESVRTDIISRVQANELKIAEIWKEIIAMKQVHATDKREIKQEFKEAVEKVDSNNRDDHRQLFEKVDALKDLIVQCFKK
jgi:hypothetical protein